MAYLGLETIRRGTTAACVQDIFRLHFPTATRVLDATYGKGRFWRWDSEAVLGHPLVVTGVDLNPPEEARRAPPAGGLYQYDYRNLADLFAPGQFDVICFDPPFVFTPGIGRMAAARGFLGREVSIANPQMLLEHYARVFAQRALASQGLILKGQDLIVREPDWWSFHVYGLARSMGLGEPTDMLIQHSPRPRMRDPRWKRQRYFRRVHGLYLIYTFPQATTKRSVPHGSCPGH